MLSDKRRRLEQIGGGEIIACNCDLLTEILVSLPVKSLVRFKSISKRWHSVISDYKFSCRRFPRISGLITFKPSTIFGRTEYEFLRLSDTLDDAPQSHDFNNDPLADLRIWHSCYGLLLCSNYRGDIYVYNPTTKQSVILPPLPNTEDEEEDTNGEEDSIASGISLGPSVVLPTRLSGITCLTLALDPTKSSQYKVVCLRAIPGLEFGDNFTSTGQIEIYSSQTRSWRLWGKSFSNKIFTNQVFCNGVIHWIKEGAGTSLIYFNVNDEKQGEVPLPPPANPSRWESNRIYFGESAGHLHLVRTHKLEGPPRTKMIVYEMESDYSGWWTVKYHVDLNPLIVAFPQIRGRYFSVLSIVREANDNEDSDSYMVLHIPGKAIRFNLENGSFKKICDFRPGEIDLQGRGWIWPSWKQFSSHQFIQTLLSFV